MAVVYSSNVVEIAVIMQYGPVQTVNVWHMYNDDEMWSDGTVGVVEDFRDNWQDHVMGILHQGVTLTEFRWHSISPSSNAAGIVMPDTGKPTTGGTNGAGVAPNTAYLVHKNTSDRPRGRRDGRSYLVGVEEDLVDAAGNIPSATVAARNAALEDFYDGISDTSINWAGDSYPVVLETTPASRAPGTASVQINSRRVTSITLDPKVATQRERLR